MLPLTSTTNTKMLAKRLFSQLRVTMKFYRHSVRKLFLTFYNFYINNIAGGSVVYKNDLVIMPGNTFSFGGYILNLNVFYNLRIFLFNFGHNRIMGKTIKHLSKLFNFI